MKKLGLFIFLFFLSIHVAYAAVNPADVEYVMGLQGQWDAVIGVDSMEGDLSTSGDVTANAFFGDGSNLTGISLNLQEVTDNGNTTTNSIYMSGDLSANGSVTTQGDFFVGSIGMSDTTSGSAGCTLVGTPAIDGATYTNLCKRLDLFNSAGRNTGGTVTNNGDGTVTVSAGTGFIKATDDDTAELLSFNWAEDASVSIDTTITWVGIEYNSGNPQVVKKNSFNDFDLDTDFPLAEIIRQTINGAYDYKIADKSWWVTDGITNVLERFLADGNVTYDKTQGGLQISNPTGTKLAITGGKLWYLFNEQDMTEIDTSVPTGSFAYLWYSSTSGWQRNGTATDYSVAQWNDTTQAALQNLNNNWYANIWVYACPCSDKFFLLYPQAQYSNSSAAEAEAPPTLVPTAVIENGILLGRLLIKEGVDAPIEIQSAFDTQFTAAQAADHGNLAGLGDDDHTQYVLADGTRPITGNQDIDGDLSVGTGLIVESGNVGIGTSSPRGILEISGAPDIYQYIGSNSGTEGDIAGIKFRNSGASYADRGSIIFRDNGSSGGLGDFHFALSSSDSEVAYSDSKMSILSSGNVGINTTSPGAKLDVNGNIRLSTIGSELQFDDTNVRLVRSGNNLIIKGWENTSIISNDGTTATFLKNGNVGIGTTSPSEKLEVSGTGSVKSMITSTDHTSALLLLNRGAYLTDAYADYGFNANGGSLDIFSATNNVYNYTMRLTSDGNVGIGTTAPSEKLEVASSDAKIYLIDNTQVTSAFVDSEIMIKTSDGNRVLGMDALGGNVGYCTVGVHTAESTLDLRLLAGNAEVMHLDSSGNVGIGTTSPTAKLHVSGDAKVSEVKDTTIVIESTKSGADWVPNVDTFGQLQFYSNDTSGGGVGIRAAIRAYTTATQGHSTDLSFTTSTASHNDNEVMRLYNNGDLSVSNVLYCDNEVGVGIGTISPLAGLQVNPSADTIGILVVQNDQSPTQPLLKLDSYDNEVNFNVFELVDENSNTNFVIQSQGNVGIGTTSPTAKLNVSGDAIVSTDLTVSNNLAVSKINANADNDVVLFGDTDVGNTTDGKSLYIYRKAAEFDRYLKFYSDQYGNNALYSVGELNIDSTSVISLNEDASGNVELFTNAGSGENPYLIQSGYITTASNEVDIQWQVSDTTDNFELTREDANIQAFDVQMPMKVSDSLELNGVLTASGTLSGSGVNYYAVIDANGQLGKSVETYPAAGGGAESDTLQTVVDRGNVSTTSLSLSNVLTVTGCVLDPDNLNRVAVFSSGQSDAWLKIISSSNGECYFGVLGTIAGVFAPPGQALSFWADGSQTQYMVGGNVGIGLTAPTAKLHVNGAVSKTSGSFDIPYPAPAMADEGWRLRHCFVESNTRGDNLYRYSITGSTDIELPSYFSDLNENAQVFITPVGHFGSAYGKVVGNICQVTCEVNDEYNVLIIATRKDQYAKDWYDELGDMYQADDNTDSIVAYSKVNAKDTDAQITDKVSKYMTVDAKKLKKIKDKFKDKEILNVSESIPSN